MSYCTGCGKKIEYGFEFCPSCGKKIDVDTTCFGFKNMHEKICPKCNSIIPEDMYYCLKCGTFFDEDDDFEAVKRKVKQQFGIWKNKKVALTLCIFLGWMGAHRYYEGKFITALIYTFSFGILGIGWVIDIIRLILKPNPYLVK